MRKQFWLAMALLAASPVARVEAQEFATKPITFIVPWSAGGATDIVCRALANAAAKHLGQPIIVDNKTGGGGTVGPATMAVSAKPDGYVFAIYAGAQTGFTKWQDVIDFAKANPGKVTYATPGAGTSPNIGTEVIAAHAGVKFSHAPFKSTAEVTTAGLGGHTMLGSTAGLDAKQFEETGKLKFLTVWKSSPHSDGWLPGSHTRSILLSAPA
jgi:tripartite-type tricarboxylate transporter receptor subunit TctC